MFGILRSNNRIFRDDPTDMSAKTNSRKLLSPDKTLNCGEIQYVPYSTIIGPSVYHTNAIHPNNQDFHQWVEARSRKAAHEKMIYEC